MVSQPNFRITFLGACLKGLIALLYSVCNGPAKQFIVKGSLLGRSMGECCFSRLPRLEGV